MLHSRTRLAALAASAVTAFVLVATVLAVTTTASAATLFVDDFEDGNANGWTKTGGSWSVVVDGTRAYRQSSTSSDTRSIAGGGSGAFTVVTARIKPTAFNGSNRMVALLGQAASLSTYYYVALRNTNRLEVGKRVNGTFTVLGSAPFTVTTGTWYSVTLNLFFPGRVIGSVTGGPTVDVADAGAGAASGKVGFGALNASATFDDIRLFDDRVEPTPSASPTPSPTPTSLPFPIGDMEGYAAVPGRGMGVTTGGGFSPVVTVTTAAQFEAEAQKSTPGNIAVQGIIPLSGQIYVRSNKTVFGVGANSGFTGGGLKVSGHSNIIFRNLRISFPTGTDAIGIQNAHHIWIDHNELWSDRNHDIDFYDGLIDITHGTDFVTVSWNILHDHWKTSLVGHDDDNAAEDTGHLTVTYAHNYWLNLDARQPSIRFGTAHIYNNLYVNGVNGIHSRMGAQVLVENNVFRNVATPIKTTTLSIVDGFAVERGNDFGGGVNNITQVGTFTAAPYIFRLDATSTVESRVLFLAGTGKISTCWPIPCPPPG